MLKLGLILLETLEELNNFVLAFYIIMLITVLAVIGIAAFYSAKKGKELVKSLESQAIKRRGEIQKRTFRYPVLRFYYKSNQVKVYSVPGGRNTPPYTYVIVVLSTPVSQHMHLYKEGFASKIGKKLGMQDIQVGVDSFDREVMVKGSDELFVRKILTYKVQDPILKIINNHRAFVFLNGNILRIGVPKLVYDEFTYDELIDTALKMVDQIEEMHIR